GKWWYPILRAAGARRGTLYSLRHSFCSLAATAGVPEHSIVRAMGHRDSTLIKKVYGHALPSGLRDVANAVSARLSTDPRPRLRVIDGGAETSSLPVSLPAQAVKGEKKRVTR